jgi:hypothetical protein
MKRKSRKSAERKSRLSLEDEEENYVPEDSHLDEEDQELEDERISGELPSHDMEIHF